MSCGNSDSDEALYYRLGIESGLLEWDNPKSWAFAVIEERDVPPIEIIEVALSVDRKRVLDALCEIQQPTHPGKAVARLFRVLEERLRNGALGPSKTLKVALYITNYSPELESARQALDIVDDDLWLVEDGVCELETVRSELLECLVSESLALENEA